jgi:hypothetical protein
MLIYLAEMKSPVCVFFSRKTEVKKWLHRENLSTAGKIAKNNTQGQNRKMLNSSVFVALKLF